jgi:hypothetical protein
MGEREDRRDGVCGGEEERGMWGAWSEGGGDGEDFRSEQVTWGLVCRAVQWGGGRVEHHGNGLQRQGNAAMTKGWGREG